MKIEKLNKILKEHKIWLTGTTKGGRADLRGTDLRGVNLSNADLSYANLSEANLNGVDLSCADLSCANLSGVNLRGANLSCADLNGVNLIGADLNCANLSWVNLRGTDLRGANLSNANLSGADLSNADLSNADLSCANLIEADLSNVKLSNTNLIQTNLRDTDLRGANLIDANLIEADLSNADLSNADLSNADLSCANLIEADLRGADLSEANLSWVRLKGIYSSTTDSSITRLNKYFLDTILPIKAKLYGLEYEFQIVLKLEGNSFKTIYLEDPFNLQPYCRQVFIDEGNLEIISKPKQTINACVEEINRLLEATFKNMTQKGYFSHQFAVMLPVPTHELHNTCKHLNMTFETNTELLHAYLFFQAKNFSIKIKESNRLHIKLPYQFRDYSELLKGNIEAEDLIKQEWQPLLIGLSNKNKRRGKRYWINKNPVV